MSVEFLICFGTEKLSQITELKTKKLNDALTIL